MEGLPVIRPQWAANANGASNSTRPGFWPASARSHFYRVVTLPVCGRLSEHTETVGVVVCCPSDPTRCP
jgi:hypothetical protein